MNEERAFVNSFVTPKRKSRYLGLLESKKGRRKFLGILNHFRDLDDRFSAHVSDSFEITYEIAQILKKKNAPDKCYVISDNKEIDGRQMDLTAALEEVVGNGIGTILSCIPGKLAYFEGEEPHERYILERSLGNWY